LKDITLSLYTVASEAELYEAETERLKAFCGRMNSRLEKMETKLKLRKVIFDEINEDALMSAGMITLKSEELDEIAAEELVGLEVDFELQEGRAFPSRIYKDVSGNVCKTISDSLLTQAVLQLAFGTLFGDVCNGDCSNCASGCGQEESGIKQ